jgi:hypothetical protein
MPQEDQQNELRSRLGTLLRQQAALAVALEDARRKQRAAEEEAQASGTSSAAL